MSYAEIRSSVHDEEEEDTCMSYAEIRSSIHDDDKIRSKLKGLGIG